jgi:hypothetical protein
LKETSHATYKVNNNYHFPEKGWEVFFSVFFSKEKVYQSENICCELHGFPSIKLMPPVPPIHLQSGAYENMSGHKEEGPS